MIWPKNILRTWFIWTLVDLKDHPTAYCSQFWKLVWKLKGIVHFRLLALDFGKLFHLTSDPYPQLMFLNLVWKHICFLWLLIADNVTCFNYFSVIIDFYCSSVVLLYSPLVYFVVESWDLRLKECPIRFKVTCWQCIIMFTCILFTCLDRVDAILNWTWLEIVTTAHMM